MKLYPENIYHIYNRGNNKQKIFFSREYYLFFLNKTRKYLKANVDIICYCLMPNHFHFLVNTPLDFDFKKFSSDYKIMLSSYCNAINVQEKRTGSLFQQNSKAKCLTDSYNRRKDYHALACFRYIHQNPLRAGLVNKMEDWEFSSFKDYIGMRDETICNKAFASEIFELPNDYKKFYELSYEVINKDILKLIF